MILGCLCTGGELAGIFRSGLIFGKMLFRRGGYVIPFEISEKWAFSDIYGLGGGRRPYFFGNQGGSRTLPGFGNRLLV